jgi:hypothetical protein
MLLDMDYFSIRRTASALPWLSTACLLVAILVSTLSLHQHSPPSEPTRTGMRHRAWARNDASLSVPPSTSFVLFAAAQLRMRTATRNVSLSNSVTKSVTPPPTRTRTPSRTPTPTHTVNYTRTRTLMHSRSQTHTHVPGPCDMNLSFSPLNLETVKARLTAGAPVDMDPTTSINYYRVRQVDVASGGIFFSIELVDGVFLLEGPPAGGIELYVKSVMLFAAISPYSDLGYPFRGDFTDDERDAKESTESHGLNRYVFASEVQASGKEFVSSAQMSSAAAARQAMMDLDARGVVTVERRPRRLYVTMRPIPAYRLAYDEFWFFNVRFNASVPMGCASSQAIIVHVTATSRSVLTQVTQAICGVVLLLGVFAACVESIPTSQHATMIAVLAEMHFAQEDGTPLPFVIHPLGVTLGTTKYRYLLGAALANTGICVGMLLLQCIAAAVLIQCRNNRDVDAALGKVKFPRITSALHVHLFPATCFAIARVFGSTTLSSYVIAGSALVTLMGMAVLVHRSSVSSVMPFDAEFVPNKQPPLTPMSPPIDVPAHVGNTILGSARLDLIRDRSGYWISTDSHRTFVERHGVVFENYNPWRYARYWGILEMCDFLWTGLLSLFDNYTTFLAFYQFGLSLLVKVALLMLMIYMRPVISRISSLLLAVVYGCQCVALLALTIGSTRRELLDGTSQIKDVVLLIASGAVAMDVIVNALRRLQRYRAAEAEMTRDGNKQGYVDVTRECRHPLMADFTRAPEPETTVEQQDVDRLRRRLRRIELELAAIKDEKTEARRAQLLGMDVETLGQLQRVRRRRRWKRYKEMGLLDDNGAIAAIW